MNRGFINIKLVKLITFFLLLIAGFIIFRVFNIHKLNPGSIRSFILSFGIWAPVVFIGIYTIRPFFFFPASLLALSSGMLFGPLFGTVYDVFGASIAAYLSFGFARKFGRDIVQDWFGKRIGKLDDMAEKNGFKTVLFMRMVPLIPFDAISYGAGFSKIRFRHFAPASTLGMLPGAFVYNFFGHSLNNVFSNTFYIALSFFLLLLITPVFYKWYKKSL